MPSGLTRGIMLNQESGCSRARSTLFFGNVTSGGPERVKQAAERAESET